MYVLANIYLKPKMQCKNENIMDFKMFSMCVLLDKM